jgi:hypothetical protein
MASRCMHVTGQQCPHHRYTGKDPDLERESGMASPSSCSVSYGTSTYDGVRAASRKKINIKGAAVRSRADARTAACLHGPSICRFVLCCCRYTAQAEELHVSKLPARLTSRQAFAARTPQQICYSTYCCLPFAIHHMVDLIRNAQIKKCLIFKQINLFNQIAPETNRRLWNLRQIRENVLIVPKQTYLESPSANPCPALAILIFSPQVLSVTTQGCMVRGADTWTPKPSSVCSG